MKKYTVLLLVLLGMNAFAGPFTEKDIPKDVEKEIIQSFAHTDSDSRRRDITDAKDAYVRLQNKAYDSGIPREDLEVIIVRLHQMYGTNFSKQAGEFDREVAQYRDMVRRIEEKVQVEKQKKEEINQQAKKEIQKLVEEKVLSKEILELLLKRANEKYPEDSLAQKYFLEGAIELQKIKR